MQYGILTENGTTWEQETDNFEEAYALYQEAKKTQRAILVHILVDSEEE